ncbi:hypothetical protein C1645_835544 [Glomus cerebriforme]|uniref:Uncharacterized protein n=1 Tax=Glomus cerebriforme TaxID=658196 RepID=A0A397SE92_9GLOM|nr:hypothetical protein C1645_835544 [Glomus cerebriforme]
MLSENESYLNYDEKDIIDSGSEDENILPKLISKMEWKELTLNRLKVSSVLQNIAKKLVQYEKNSLGELCKIATMPYLQDEIIYDIQEHYDLE